MTDHIHHESAGPTAGLPGGPADSRALDQLLKDQLWEFAQQSPEHAVFWADANQVVTWVNPGALRLFGTDMQDVLGSSLARFFTSEDVERGIPEHERAVAVSYGAGEDDRWMMRADGSRFWATGFLVAIKDADGALKSFVKVLRDATPLKMQLETLANRALQSGTASESIGRSIAVMVHELRNPLGAISLAASTLRIRTADQPALHKSLGIIDRSIQMTVRLLDDLENSARVETGNLVLSVETLHLHDILQQAQHAAFSRDQASHVVELLAPMVPITLEGDRHRLQQVFANLIVNALKFTPDGGRVWIKATVEGETAVVRIEDNGIGIAPEMLERIFEMFTQAESQMSSVGMGIGLALVKRLVELHGGSVQAKSDGIGKGSEFIVRLPLAHPAAEQAAG